MKRYVVLKALEGVALGFLFYWPWVREATSDGLAWSMACGVITGFGIDYLCERI